MYLPKKIYDMKSLFISILMVLFLGISITLNAQKTNVSQNRVEIPRLTEDFQDGLKFRNIGPFRGGRSAAVTGSVMNPLKFYFGSTGGGVWKTKDGGQTWENISDGFFGGSIGAIAVAPSDENVIYVGGGEKTVRGNVSFGYGAYKSVDEGKTWKSIGLEKAKHISRIRINPKDPDIIYAAVMGDLYKPGPDRGVYKSRDGGAHWKRVLFANDDAGAVDLIMDPNNHRILYASTWNIRRTPYSLSSGGVGSGLWKSVDEGETWTNISNNEGFPEGVLGIIGVSVSPVNPEKIYAIVEADEGGLFVSEDAGETWSKKNSDRNLRQRAWYYSRVYASPGDENMVYVLNVSYHKSTDGGSTFKRYGAPHGDHHDLWIDPNDPKRMIIGDDGGAQISFDGGENWSTYMNQPTAQFYRITTDNHFPFRIYGAQQDNSTVRILHRTDGSAITEKDWESTAGGESAHLAVDPLNNDIVYGGSYGGFLVRQDHSNGQSRAINVWPDNPMGYGAEGMKYRFQWNFPIFFSPHNKKKLYAASNHLHISLDEGQSWKTISPDLTRNDPEKLKSSGGPITQDNTGVEYYCTIFAACESPYEEDLIWTGSDDGRIHISRDAGQQWVDVTPKMAPEWLMYNSIDPDPFVDGGAYVAGTLYKEGDYQPYLFQTKDYGKTWTKIVNGIPQEHFTRVLRADPSIPGLLYAGTETGLYISFNDGKNWEPFQMNLPIVPITDLAIKENKLLVATQGRSFWILDDLTVIRQLATNQNDPIVQLFKPEDAWRYGPVIGNRKSLTNGQNHPGGVQIYYHLRNEIADSLEIRMEILDQEGKIIKSLSSKDADRKNRLDAKKGLNLITWDMKYKDAEGFDGLIMWAGSLTGPTALPGDYSVRLNIGIDEYNQEFRISSNPNSPASLQDLQDQFDFLLQARDTLSQVHIAIRDIRILRKSLNAWLVKINEEESGELAQKVKGILSEIKQIEENLYQTKNQSNQDPLNYPIKLNNKLAHLASLVSIGDNPPTQQSYQLLEELYNAIGHEMEHWKLIKTEKLLELEKDISASDLPLLPRFD